MTLRFTLAEVERANDEWGCNCGPAALAAVTGHTLDEIRPLMGDFEKKRYTNPKLMFESLKRTVPGHRFCWNIEGMPTFGLLRIQWEGPWTEPGVPIRVRYWHTHWVGINQPLHAALLNQVHRDAGIFDVNAMNSGGWIAYSDWATSLVPWLLEACEPKANGRWHITHRVQIERASCDP